MPKVPKGVQGVLVQPELKVESKVTQEDKVLKVLKGPKGLKVPSKDTQEDRELKGLKVH